MQGLLRVQPSIGAGAMRPCLHGRLPDGPLAGAAQLLDFSTHDAITAACN